MKLSERHDAIVRVILFSFALMGFATPALGAADFFEGFNGLSNPLPGTQGPPELIGQGWQFVNHSSPVGPWAWSPSGPGDPDPQEGAQFIQSNPLATGTNGSVSAWAILPVVTGLQAGDEVSLYVRSTQNPGSGQVLELRYSPSGGTNVGSGFNDTGDFTESLLVLDPPPTSVEFWTLFTAVVPGNGRLALWHRYIDGPAEVEIDAFGINQDLSTGGPPIPNPGETVTWTLADSPIVFDSTVLIPEGATVIVDPGVAIDVTPDGSLAIAGEMIAHGTQQNPIVFTGGFEQFPLTAAYRVMGTLDLAFAQVTGTLTGQDGGTILAADCTFIQGEVRTRQALFPSQPQLVRVDRCNFSQGGGIHVVDGTLAVRDSTFDSIGAPLFLQPGGVSVLRGYLYIDDAMIDGGRVSLVRERSPQTAFINNVTVVNRSSGPGLNLFGWDFLLGPNNVLQNNQFAVQLAGGLLPESIVPLTGNVNNYIPAGSLSLDPLPWPDLGLPYVMGNDFGTIGAIEFMPGTIVEIPPDVGPIVEGPVPLFHGLPDNPTVFRPHQPGQNWAGMTYLSPVTPAKVENAVFEGADLAVAVSNARVHMDNCLLQNNVVGSNSNTFGTTFIRKTRFFNNVVGAMGTGAPVSNGTPVINGATNPNWFEGNTTAVLNQSDTDIIDATFNYWGDPTGPADPSNPAGLGDPIDGFILFNPFRTQAPDFNDHPPVVRLNRSFFFADVGDHKLLTWELFEADDVVSQRVVMIGGVLEPDVILADGLPPDQRSFEFVVPPDPSERIIVEAVDAVGQVGFDQAFFTFGTFGSPAIEFTTPLDGPFTQGDEVEVCWQFPQGFGGSITSTWLWLDAENRRIPIGGAFQNCIAGNVRMPYVSTDLARIVLISANQQQPHAVFVSDYFELRPDSRIGDAPPSVTLLTPGAGDSYAGGSIVPVSWSASDDEGVREYSVQASFDGGRVWETIARDIPGENGSFDWRLPPSTGIADVRVRVVAWDMRFQNSSDTSGAFTVTPGGSGISGDIDGDGDVDEVDSSLFVGVLLGSNADALHVQRSDLNGDGIANGADVSLFIVAMIGG